MTSMEQALREAGFTESRQEQAKAKTYIDGTRCDGLAVTYGIEPAGLAPIRFTVSGPEDDVLEFRARWLAVWPWAYSSRAKEVRRSRGVVVYLFSRFKSAD